MDQKISVALCTYNGAKFLAKQLESIFNQSYPVAEIVICDDGSTDETEDIIKSFSEKHPGIIRFYKNEKNLRSVKNFEKAISLCEGDLIFLSDQDDLWHHDKAEKIISFFDQDPSAECVFTNALLIDDDDRVIEGYKLWQTVIFHPRMIKERGGFWQAYQYYDNMVTGATLCFKKKAKEFIFPFPVAEYFHHDEWMALHFAQRNTLRLLDDTLISYRIHAEQQVGADLVQRYEREKEYAEMVINLERPKNFKLYFKVFKRLYASHNKLYILSREPESRAIDIDKLRKGNLEQLKKTAHKIRKRFPIQFTGKRIHDYLRGKRQVHP